MQSVKGNIWHLSSEYDGIVIPVNIGWRKDGRNVMGKGLAFDALKRWPWLDEAWGAICRKDRERTSVFAFQLNSKWCRSVFLFPTKPLDEEKPYLSWRQNSDIGLIKESALSLLAYIKSYPDLADRVFVPSVGCGNGGLDESVVLPVLSGLLPDKFIHVSTT